MNDLCYKSEICRTSSGEQRCVFGSSRQSAMPRFMVTKKAGRVSEMRRILCKPHTGVCLCVPIDFRFIMVGLSNLNHLAYHVLSSQLLDLAHILQHVRRVASILVLCDVYHHEGGARLIIQRGHSTTNAANARNRAFEISELSRASACVAVSGYTHGSTITINLQVIWRSAGLEK